MNKTQKLLTILLKVLGKACKVIPVMLMGKLVSGNTYKMYEWITAGMLSVGISFFVLGHADPAAAADASSSTRLEIYTDNVVIVSGFVLMIGYMVFDSFTSIWQVSSHADCLNL